MKATALIGRILFSLMFIFAAFGHFKSETIAYAAASGVPFASLAVPASGILAFVGGVSVLVGYRARWGAAALIAFLLPVTFMMHKFWTVSDPMMQQLQLTSFLKNLALAGGAFIIATFGAGAYSLDARAEARETATRRTVGATA